jgi:hypothetical protein
MTRTELKQAIREGRATPHVENALFESCVAEVCREDYGPTARVVTLQEAAPPPVDAHARMRALLESTVQTPRSDLKADALATAPEPQAFAPDFDAAVAAAVANYKANWLPIRDTAPAPRKTYQTLSEVREDLARRVPDPIARAYIILSGRDR